MEYKGFPVGREQHSFFFFFFLAELAEKSQAPDPSDGRSPTDLLSKSCPFFHLIPKVLARKKKRVDFFATSGGTPVSKQVFMRLRQ